MDYLQSDDNLICKDYRRHSCSIWIMHNWQIRGWDLLAGILSMAGRFRPNMRSETKNSTLY